MKSRATGSVIIVAVAAVGALALAASPSVAVEAVYPVEHAKRTFVTRVWSRVRGFFNGASAAAENVRLKREVDTLVLVGREVERLEQENARLRRALGLKEKSPRRWIAAEVLAHAGGAGGSRMALRIDRGLLDGVADGAVVVVPDGLVGRVVSATPHTSEVVPLTDVSVKVHVATEVGTVRGIAVGGSDAALVVRSANGSFSTADEVPPRTRVITTGLGGVFPPGIEVGSWLGFSTGESGTVTGIVEPSVNIGALEEVFVLREE